MSSGALHERHLCFGALVWAAAGKDPGLTPELILDWTKRQTVSVFLTAFVSSLTGRRAKEQNLSA